MSFRVQTTEPTPSLPAAGVARVSVYLQPGDLIATRTPTMVKTILGSCISVCLWDDGSAVGGINHYLLPYGSAAADRPARFGCFAIESLIAAVCEQGGRRQHLQAKLFGGASRSPPGSEVDQGAE